MLDLHRLRDQDYTGLRIPSSALDSYTSTGNLVEWVSWRTLQRINVRVHEVYMCYSQHLTASD